MKYFLTVFSFLMLTATTALMAQNVLPPPKNGNTYVIAHRGAHQGIPENSLAAYQHAIDLGCDFVEIDVRTTEDGKFVSIHNSTIDKYVQGRQGRVRDLTLDQLKALDIGQPVGPKWKGTRIPTFEEILELCHGKINVYLDLKDAEPAALIEIIRRYNMEQNIVWYVPASRHKTLMDIKQHCPSCLIMPDPGPERNIETVMTAYQPKVLASDMGQLSDLYVKKAHEHHAMVFVDDDAETVQEWQQIVGWGTEGIQTNRPEALIRFLKTTEK